jgi:hypothetical protein
VNRNSLRGVLQTEQVREYAYSIDGTLQDESMCLEAVPGGWAVFYAERGLRSGERVFGTEDEACQFLAGRLLADPSNRLG